MKTWLLLSFVFIIAISIDLSASAYALVQTGSSGILLISYTGTSTQLQDYVTTDKTNYVLGMGESAIALISGHVSGVQPMVTIAIKTPDGESMNLTWNTDPMGYFSVPYLIDLNAPAGQYDVTVYYNGGQVSANFYVMRS
jgi:hypothetical protein